MFAMKQLAGFTLIEMIFIVVVVAILAAVVMPRVGRGGLLNKFSVYTSAHQIAADMRYARRLAVTSGTQHRVRFFATGSSSDYNEYTIQQAASWANVSVAKAIDDDITVTGDASVTFSNNGAADSDHSFSYELGGHTYSIDVNGATGRTKLSGP